jgi:hypothetical protein
LWETTPSTTVIVKDDSSTAQRNSSAAKSAEKRPSTSQLSPEIDVERLLDNDNSFTDASAKKKRRLSSNFRPSPGISAEVSSKSAQSKHRSPDVLMSSIFDEAQTDPSPKAVSKSAARSKKPKQVDAAKANLNFSPQQSESVSEIKGRNGRQPNEALAAPTTAASASGSRRSKQTAVILPDPVPASEQIGSAASSARQRRRPPVQMNQLEDEDVDELLQVSIPAQATLLPSNTNGSEDDELVSTQFSATTIPAVSQPAQESTPIIYSVISAVRSKVSSWF